MGTGGQNLGYDRGVSRFRGLHGGSQARKPRADDHYVMVKNHLENASMEEKICASSIGVRHLVGIYDAIELIGQNVAEPERCFFERQAFARSQLGDLCCPIVADDWYEGRDEHERAIQVVVYPFPVRFHTGNQKLRK